MMKKRIADFGMKEKILISFFVFISVPITVFFLFSCYQMREQKKEYALKNAHVLIESIHDNVQGELDSIIANLISLSSNKGLVNLLSYASEEDSGYDRSWDFVELQEYAKMFHHKVQIFVPDFMICSDELELSTIISMESALSMNWFSDFMESKSGYYLGIDKQTVFAAQKVYSKSNINKVVGVVKISIDQADVIGNMDTIFATDNTINCILDSNNQLIFISANTDTQKLQEHLLILLKNERSNRVLWEYEDEEYYYIGNNLETVNLFYLSMIPKTDIKGIVNKTTLLWVVVLIVVAAIAFVFAGLVAKSIIRPIKDLSEQIDLCKNEKIPENTVGKDLKSIAYAYNNSLDRIRKLIRQNTEMMMQNKTASVELLNLQIHPHFLYNALNMLMWEAKKNNCLSVEQGINTLSSFLRLSLKRKSEIVPLQDELEHISEYMKIQNMRYENAVSFEMNILPCYHKILIPSFTLQPIVENAINHGILRKESENGRIVLDARQEGDDLIIQIMDDGIGMSSVKCYQMNSECHDGVRGDLGIGIYDVNMRLRLFFGIEYYLVFNSTENSGTCVSVRIPYRESYNMPDFFEKNGENYDSNFNR